MPSHPLAAAGVPAACGGQPSGAAELGLDVPAHQLDLRTADPEALRGPITAVVDSESPDAVLVYGDTNSTLAGAQAGVAAALPVAHVEAGLRSGDLEMPEERNRIEVDRMAQLLFTPNERSSDQLAAEGVPGRAEVVGDVMADATRLFEPIARKRVDLSVDEPYDVLTIHREANTGPDRLQRLVESLGATGRTFVFPVHPRTRKVLDEHGIEPAPEIRQIAPVGYLEMLALVAGARAVVTDSGGLQKEAYWYGVPCVTVRPSTEWVDTVAVGANVLVDADPIALSDAVAGATMPRGRPVLYGDGHASERIAQVLVATIPSR